LRSDQASPLSIRAEFEMGLIPEPMLDARRKLSEQYIIGTGVELGALHCPLWTSKRATVRYVDRLDVTGLRTYVPVK